MEKENNSNNQTQAKDIDCPYCGFVLIGENFPTGKYGDAFLYKCSTCGKEFAIYFGENDQPKYIHP